MLLFFIVPFFPISQNSNVQNEMTQLDENLKHFAEAQQRNTETQA
jgi:hypothetical protein